MLGDAESELKVRVGTVAPCLQGDRAGTELPACAEHQCLNLLRTAGGPTKPGPLTCLIPGSSRQSPSQSSPSGSPSQMASGNMSMSAGWTRGAVTIPAFLAKSARQLYPRLLPASR
jgi:hypothetical protein